MIHNAQIGCARCVESVSNVSFTDQQPRIATEADCSGEWDGSPNGLRFRCTVCGYRFRVGDVWRWHYSAGLHIGKMGLPNSLLCGGCDGPDVNIRIVEHWREAITRFWHLFSDADLEAKKTYIGDGVCVEFDGYAFVLTTEDGSVTNTIVLEPDVYQSLVDYATVTYKNLHWQKGE